MTILLSLLGHLGDELRPALRAVRPAANLRWTFPGRRTNAYADYVYFAIGVATTFGATDVSVTTPEMRRIVNLNVIVSFVYNSVIVALLVSILIR